MISRTKKEILVNLGFSALEVAFALEVVRLANARLTAVSFGLFFLARRVSATVACLTQLGGSRTIIRYGALAADDPETRRDIVNVSWLLWAAVSVLLLGMVMVGRQHISAWLFPRAEGADLALPCVLAVIGLTAYYFASSALLAERFNTSASILGLLSTNGLFVALLWLGRGWPVAKLIETQGFYLIGVSLLASAVHLSAIRMPIWGGWTAVRRQFRVIIDYGLPRTLNDFLDLSVVSIIPFLIRGNVIQSGYLLVALSVVRITESLVLPVVKLAGVITAQCLGRGDHEAIAAGLRILFGALLYAGTLATAFGYPWCSYLMHVWLGATTSPGVLAYLTVILGGVIPISIYHGLKNVIDARWVFPRNTLTLLAGVLTQCVIFYALQGDSRMAVRAGIAEITGLAVLGLGSFLWVFRYLPSLHYYQLLRLGAVAALTFAVNYAAALLPNALTCAAACAASVALIWTFFGFHNARTPFLREFWSYLLPNKIPLEARAASSA